VVGDVAVSRSLDEEIRYSTYPRLIGTGFLDCCSPRIRRIWEYWDRQRGARPMPARHDIDPLGIPSDLLSGVLLTEVLKEAPWLRYRLVGTGQAALRGHDPTGQPVQNHYMGVHLGVGGNEVMLNYRIVIEKKTLVYTQNPISGALPDGSSLRQTPLHAKSSLLMPLSGDGETVDMVFCYTDLEIPAAA
jgi:hypothetical protein